MKSNTVIALHIWHICFLPLSSCGTFHSVHFSDRFLFQKERSRATNPFQRCPKVKLILLTIFGTSNDMKNGLSPTIYRLSTSSLDYKRPSHPNHSQLPHRPYDFFLRRRSKYIGSMPSSCSVPRTLSALRYHSLQDPGCRISHRTLSSSSPCRYFNG